MKIHSVSAALDEISDGSGSFCSDTFICLQSQLMDPILDFDRFRNSYGRT
jgi:hypothetical protein